MRDLILKLTLSEEKAAAFEGGNAMVTPLSEAEVEELRRNILSVESYFGPVLSFFLSMDETAASVEDEEAESIRGALAEFAETTRAAAAMHDRSRELLGRAVFVGSDKGRVLQ